jgi:hypothetical protein
MLNGKQFLVILLVLGCVAFCAIRLLELVSRAWRQPPGLHIHVMPPTFYLSMMDADR